MEDLNDYLDPEDIAARLGWHVESVRRKLRRGGFPGAITIKGRWLLSPEDYKAYIEGSGTKRVK